jgi:AAA domain-containing protein/bifunctional DNA primase/polymerase-like protein
MAEITPRPAALTDEEIEAIKAETRRQAEALDAKLAATPDDDRKARFLAMQAAIENRRREERNARVAARKAEKAGTKMPNVTERADETAGKAEIAGRSESAKESNVTPLWPAAKAVAAIKRARADGYFPITILPFKLKRDNAGKQPARFDRGLWGGWKDWETQVQTATLDALTDWQGHSSLTPNVGILCGTKVKDGTKAKGGVFIGVDIDCEAPELVYAIAKLADGIAIRKGSPERSGLIALVVDELGEHEVFKCGDDKIQLLREGKQFVAAGIHPKSKRPYCWEDSDELPVDMPALAELPRVAMADLVRVLGENGFAPSTASASKPASGRKAELLAELRDSEIDADSFDELFVDEGAPFPLAELRKNNPAFDRLYAKYVDGVDNPESVSHHGSRVAVCKDFLRAWPDDFAIEHAAVFCEGWPGAGQRVDKREAKGEWDDERLSNAFAPAEAAIKSEKAGEVKQHTSTKEYTGESFGAVEDDESEEGVAQSTGATSTSAKKGPKAPKSEPWYENAAFIPVDLDVNKLPPRPYLYNHYLLRGHVTLLSASGGIGKSAWFLSAAIDMACGVDHLDAGEFKWRKVLVYNAEDDLTEMLRRRIIHAVP